jgi:hypothetical protein
MDKVPAHEEGVEAETNDIGGQGEHENVDLGVLESHDQSVENALVIRVGICLSHILLHSHSGDKEFFLGEASRVGGQVG